MKEIISIVIFLFGLFGLAKGSWATTYYVDYDSGSDGNDGRSITAPWQHCPGDFNATGVPANTTLTGGDTVYFKAGVRYRGKILMGSGTSASSRLIYNGQPAGWGSGKAIIDGTTPIANNAWTQCMGSNCPRITNNHVYMADLSTGADIWSTVFENYDAPMYSPQNPAGTDPFYDWQVHTVFYNRTTDAANTMTRTQVVDDSFFTQSSSAYYDNSIICAWGNPNVIYCRPISAYTPAEHKVTFPPFPNDPYTDPKMYFTILNNINDLSSAGRYYIDLSNTKIHVWPSDNGAPNNITVGGLTRGFYYTSASYTTIDSFILQGQSVNYAGSIPDGGAYGGIYGYSPNYLTVQNSDFRNIWAWDSAVPALSMGSANFVISNNTLDHIRGGRGIMAGGLTGILSNNKLTNIGYSGVYLSGDDITMTQNSINSPRGSHGNCLTIYGDAPGLNHRIMVSKNIIRCGDSLQVVAINYSADTTFENNVFMSGDSGGYFADWRDCTGYMKFYNNSFSGAGIYLGSKVTNSSPHPTYYFYNNIIPGLGSGTGVDMSDIQHDYNCFVGAGGEMDPIKDGWTKGGHEVCYTCTATSCSANLTENDVYTNPAQYDLRPKAGSVTIDAGSNLSAYFTTDYSGISRPQGPAWDIGAYEFVPGGDTTAPAAPSGLSVN